MQAQPASEQRSFTEIAERQIGVGHRRFGSATAVTGRTRIGAGAHGSDCQQSHFAEMRDAAAAGADLDHVNDRRTDRQTASALEAVHTRRLQHRSQSKLAVFDKADLGRRSTHVECDDIFQSQPAAQVCRHQPASGGPRFQQTHRQALHHLGRGEIAGRLNEI